MEVIMGIEVTLDSPRRGEHTVEHDTGKDRYRLRFASRQNAYGHARHWQCIAYSVNGRGLTKGRWSYMLVSRLRARLLSKLRAREQAASNERDRPFAPGVARQAELFSKQHPKGSG